MSVIGVKLVAISSLLSLARLSMYMPTVPVGSISSSASPTCYQSSRTHSPKMSSISVFKYVR
ncbi:hypothetical protein PF011_g12616 [Phytophthora fragariae]|uniref:RxLR effector protein n=1 Tax=Phytophthora fragariae TaxID=53985 RepID=A0A6A3K9G6_9STRA|nr:hypothetical protein PF011_g12616 [Phytophthora fragariae]KAE9337758.1 hypothetical protein PF008_g12384 [Phytophthora fragariae]